MIKLLTEYKSNYKYNKDELNNFVNYLYEEIIHNNDVLKKYRQYENGDETKQSLGTLFNDIADEISRKDEVRRVKFNISSKEGLSNYIEVFFNLPFGVTKNSLKHYKIRLSDHPPKQKEFNEISIPIIGFTVNQLKDDIIKIVDSRIDLIDKEEHKYLYSEVFNMVIKYTKGSKIIKEDIDDASYISLIDTDTMKSIKEFRTEVKDIAKLIMNNSDILNYTDAKLYDVTFNCDLGPDNEWFNSYCEDAWEMFKEYCSDNFINIDNVRNSNSKFYLTEADDYIIKYVRDNAYDSSNIGMEELEELISMAYGDYTTSYPYNDIYEYVMSDSKLEEYLHDCYVLWGADAGYDDLQEFVNDAIDGFDTDFKSDLANGKSAIDSTIKAYKYISDFKATQVEDYNSWLEDSKEYNPEYFNN